MWECEVWSACKRAYFYIFLSAFLVLSVSFSMLAANSTPLKEEAGDSGTLLFSFLPDRLSGDQETEGNHKFSCYGENGQKKIPFEFLSYRTWGNFVATVVHLSYGFSWIPLDIALSKIEGSQKILPALRIVALVRNMLDPIFFTEWHVGYCKGVDSQRGEENELQEAFSSGIDSIRASVTHYIGVSLSLLSVYRIFGMYASQILSPYFQEALFEAMKAVEEKIRGRPLAFCEKFFAREAFEVHKQTPLILHSFVPVVLSFYLFWGHKNFWLRSLERAWRAPPIL